MAEEIKNDEAPTITHHQAAEQLADNILNLLPDSMPVLGLRACCYLVGALAAHCDNSPDTIERPDPELGLTWIKAATSTVEAYYKANRKGGKE